MINYPSKLVEEAVNEISKLPGIGKKTALRLALHLLKQPESATENLATALENLRKNITYCHTCFMMADLATCTCQGPRTDQTVICVVEDTPDLIAIRNTGQYNGMFHVLRGRISPLDGIGPDELTIESLVTRIKHNPEIKEVILALSATMEGDTTAFYITKRLATTGIKLTTIARGIPVGGELEYADEITLGRSITSRIPYV